MPSSDVPGVQTLCALNTFLIQRMKILLIIAKIINYNLILKIYYRKELKNAILQFKKTKKPKKKTKKIKNPPQKSAKKRE